MALHLARSVLQQLTDEWPDVHLVLRTMPNDTAGSPRGSPGDGSEERAADTLLDALLDGTLSIAIAQAETLPPTLPEGVTIAAVTRRLEPRSALLTRGPGELDALPAGAKVGVSMPHDARFLRATRRQLELTELAGTLDDQVALLASGELQAIVTPAAPLFAQGMRDRVKSLLDPTLVTPPIGQGATALLVRSDDDPAFEIAYTMQHRPSFDRLLAERSFAEALGAEPIGLLAGALATLTDEGELHLIGAAILGDDGLRASATGRTNDGAKLGARLGAELRAGLKADAATSSAT